MQMLNDLQVQLRPVFEIFFFFFSLSGNIECMFETDKKQIFIAWTS